MDNCHVFKLHQDVQKEAFTSKACKDVSIKLKQYPPLKEKYTFLSASGLILQYPCRAVSTLQQLGTRKIKNLTSNFKMLMLILGTCLLSMLTSSCEFWLPVKKQSNAIFLSEKLRFSFKRSKFSCFVQITLFDNVSDIFLFQVVITY